MKIIGTFVIASFLLLQGCAGVSLSPQERASANFGTPPADYEAAIQGLMTRILKDPGSATYRFGKPRKGFTKDGWARGGKVHFGYIVPADVNAKNSYGGYAGESAYYFLFSGGMISDVTSLFELGRGAYVESAPDEGGAVVANPVPPQSGKQSASPSLAVAAVPPTEKDVPGLIKMFSGSGVTTTRPFTVPPKWEMQWKSEGGVFAIYLKDGEGKKVAVPASQTGPGSGSAYHPAGGEYILQVISTGSPWTIKVVKVD